MSPPASSLRDLGGKILHKFLLRPIGYGHPVPKVALDAEYRDGHWEHFHAAAEQPRYAAILRMIAAFGGDCPAILDVGCGSGRLPLLLEPERRRHYVGVDLSTEGLARARRLGLADAEFIEGNFETWRPVGKFDVIVFNESIGYARDPAAVTRAFARQLNSTGILIVSQFRFGHHRALWRRILRGAQVRAHDVVSPPNGAPPMTWDVRAFVYPAVPGAR